MESYEITAPQTLRDWVHWGADQFEQAGLFYGHGTDNALDEALSLVLHAVQLDYSVDESRLDEPVSQQQAEQISGVLQQRIKSRVPAAYIIGEAYFAGMPFYVDEHVLVPRSPIAELILQGFEPWLQPQLVQDVLDLCTGSGCIGIACTQCFPNAHIDAADIDDEALQVARKNIDRHRLQLVVTLLKSDVFENIPEKKYDLIVSNPPYVSLQEMQTLPEEYQREPALGLEAGIEGLDIVSRILRQARDYLKPGGIIVVEVGSSAEYLLQRYPRVPFMWLEFEHGGDGVFLLTAEQLDEFQTEFDEV